MEGGRAPAGVGGTGSGPRSAASSLAAFGVSDPASQLPCPRLCGGDNDSVFRQ